MPLRVILVALIPFVVVFFTGVVLLAWGRTDNVQLTGALFAFVSFFLLPSMSYRRGNGPDDRDDDDEDEDEPEDEPDPDEEQDEPRDEPEELQPVGGPRNERFQNSLN
jgi:hypothetical protein